ncbi:chemotaxis protein CheA [Mesoterricola silvestris]|uniref:Chemotaxis protein CheA n=1 Tax=Mesoterricola silvestris TaxID=2927979 RepID=A0AA48GMI4_9BACT|nr:chemotaxis protein CheA [Mesoterricola silvestris]BDU72584.1 chemotaxis protein CheA [Mesoterricola silvestris]
MADAMDAFKESFLEESTELVDGMEAVLLKLDFANPEVEDLHTLFRAAHSIKGNAATFGFPAIAAFTHQLESTLEPVRQGRLAMTPELQEILLGAVDVLRAHLGQARSGSALQPRDLANEATTLQELARLAQGTAAPAARPAPAPPPPSLGAYQIRFQAPLDLFRRGINLERIFRDLEKLGTARFWLDPATLPPLDGLEPEDCHLLWNIHLETGAPLADVEEVFEFVNDGANLAIKPLDEKADRVPLLGEILVGSGEVSPHQVQDALSRQANIGDLLVEMGAARPEAVAKAVEQQQKKRTQVEASTLRVATDKIDKLVNLVGEIVITQTMLAQSAQEMATAHGIARFNEALVALERLTRELQERVMGVRMVPVEMIFSRFPRMVRELAKQLEKDVNLVMEGQATELDKTFIEMLVDPITHLVRNGLDHGLEPVEQRIAAGKPAQATLSLKASSRGGNIFIEIQDDGRGLDRQRILAKAQEKGMVAADARMSDEEVYALLFEPGFSTAAAVSDLSGRGVGLDVVRQNIRALGGRVEVESRLGAGSTFRLVLPLTMAVLDGLTVRIGTETYVFPLSLVLESFKPRPGSIQSIQGDRHVINLRGSFMPVLPLEAVLSLGDRDGGREGDDLLVVVESDGRRAAVRVDEVLGQQQVVIKSLDTHYRKVQGISGATILGDGRVALILDVAELIHLESSPLPAPV